MTELTRLPFERRVGRETAGRNVDVGESVAVGVIHQVKQRHKRGRNRHGQSGEVGKLHRKKGE